MELFRKLTSKRKSPDKQKSNPPPPAQPKLHEPNPNAPKPKGILKNAKDAKKYSNTNAYPTSDDIDESLRNAQKNSSLNQSLGTTQSGSPLNEQEMKQNEKRQKDLKWDEANLQKNEEEKVPRMKIDEPPTPYAEMPAELRHDYDPHEDVEEVILDSNPMEMEISFDEQHEPDLHSNDAVLIPTEQTLSQQRQALLLQDEEYRNKMINDALERREDQLINTDNSQNTQKIVKSAWESDDDDQNTPDPNQQDQASDATDDEKKKAAFRKKRKAHYNEFHAIRAWRASQTQQNND